LKASGASKGRISKLRRSSSNIIIMLRCVKGRNSKLRRLTLINYSLFVSLKNRWKMAKSSNEIIIIVLNFVRMIILSFCNINAISYTLLRCSTVACITHKGRNYKLRPFTAMHFLQRWRVRRYAKVGFFQTIK